MNERIDLVTRANEGDIDAMYEYAELLNKRTSNFLTDLDFHKQHQLRAEAIIWYKKAAEKGHVKAQLHLGHAYQHAREGSGTTGVKKDIEKSVYWYGKAAAQGDEYAKKILSKGVSSGGCCLVSIIQILASICLPILLILLTL